MTNRKWRWRPDMVVVYLCFIMPVLQLVIGIAAAADYIDWPNVLVFAPTLGLFIAAVIASIFPEN